MKLEQNHSKTGIAVLALGLLLSGAGCRQASRARYQFESTPSNVLAAVAKWSMAPQLGISPAGTLYLLALYGDDEKKRLGMAVSHNGGDTFDSPIPIGDEGADIRAQGESSPALFATSTSIYALWEQSNASGPSDLMFARSRSGQSFDRPIRVSDKTQPSFNGFASLAVAPAGDVYAAWLDGRNPSEMHGTFSVYLARSTDRGASFKPNVLVANGSCPCCRPKVAPGMGGAVYVTWRKVFQGNIRDMVVSASKDAGETFAPPVRIAEDNWKINGCPESGATALVVGRRLYVAWMTEATPQQAGVKLAWSDDGAKSFAPPLLVSKGLLDANHPVLSASGDSDPVLVFQARAADAGQNWNPQSPYLVEIDATGRISPPAKIPVSASISYPTVALGSAGRAFFAWNQSGEGGSRIFFSRGRKGL